MRPLGLRRIERVWAAARAAETVVSRAVRAGTWRDRMRNLARVAVRARHARGAHAVAQSGLFDASYYCALYPDVSRAGIDPLLHYLLWGWAEGRSPHPLFDPTYYREQSPDVARATLNPLSHFVLHGGLEERNPGPLFDSRYYLACYPDVRATGENPLVHFVRVGWREGRNPSPSFDCAAYVARYADVRSSDVNPLVHYALIGQREGRDTSSIADAPLPGGSPVRLVSRPLFNRGLSKPLVVCLTHVSPWPPRVGNAYRVFRLLRRLQHDGFRIVPVIAPLAGEAPAAESIGMIERLFSNVVVLERDGRIRYAVCDAPDVLGTLDGERTARFSSLLHEEHPISQRERELLVIDRTYCHDVAVAAVLRLHSALGQYVLLTEYVWMTRLLPLLDDRAIKVVDTHDVYSTKRSKVLSAGVADLWLEPEEEARRLRHADLIIAIQDEERAALRNLMPDVAVVTAGIDFDVVADETLPDAHRVLYVGSGNLINVRGLSEFLRLVWPSIRRDVPDAELIVAGTVCRAFDDVPAGVTLLGEVRDLDELYERTRVVINPAFAGTGLKIKTLEALSRLRPIVTLPAGADGLARPLLELCDAVNDWSQFGPRVVTHLVSGRSEAFAARARETIIRLLSPDAVYGEMSSTLRRVWDERQLRRAADRRVDATVR